MKEDVCVCVYVWGRERAVRDEDEYKERGELCVCVCGQEVCMRIQVV